MVGKLQRLCSKCVCTVLLFFIVRHRRIHSMIVIKSLTKVDKSWKTFCILLCNVNGAFILWNPRLTPPILLHHLNGAVWRNVPPNISWVPCLVISLLSGFSLAQVTAFWESVSNKAHQWAKSLLWVWLSGNNWERSQWVSFEFCRASQVEKSSPGTWSQNSSWCQERSRSGIQVFRSSTATCLLMACLIRAVC